MEGHRLSGADRMIGIYAIRNLVSGKAYIGSSRDIEARWSGHRCALRYGRHHSDHLQMSWEKHGATSFAFDILEECPERDLVEREFFWIETLGTNQRTHGYNLDGAEGGHFKRSPETLARMSASQRGKTISQETRDRIAAAHRGARRPMETRLRIKAAALKWRSEKPRGSLCPNGHESPAPCRACRILATRRRTEERRSAGLCRSCSLPAAPGSSRCENHKKMRRTGPRPPVTACKRGHPRTPRSGPCTACRKLTGSTYSDRYAARHPERVRENQARYRAKVNADPLKRAALLAYKIKAEARRQARIKAETATGSD